MKGRRGFDAIVGNPPFLGGTIIGGRLGLAYHAYVIEVAPPATGLADLVAFFLRRGYALLRGGGALGLLATNTVSQGDTREASLAAITAMGGTIYSARRRFQWPGDASVVISIIHVLKDAPAHECTLDGKTVGRISAFLLPGHADATPVALPENRGRGYVGSKIWGAGFVFEENPAGGSWSLDDMQRAFESDPRARERVFSFMGGEEFNSSPTQAANRFVIDFGEMSEEAARGYPTLYRLVEERVRPVRAGNKQRNYRESWWLHVTRVPEAAAYLRDHGRLLAMAKVSKHLCLAFVGAGTTISDRMLLVLAHADGAFAVMQSRVHEAWARLVGTTMRDDLSYTTECFDTFPSPELRNAKLDAVGRQYNEFRAALMVQNDEGLTKTYNRFHDPEERSPDIIKLRGLHAEMDRAVLDAYGWTDIKPAYDFREQLDESTRFTWGEETRDEVLARLLELNRVRAEEEAKSAPKPKPTKGTAKKTKKRQKDEASANLFGDDE